MLIWGFRLNLRDWSGRGSQSRIVWAVIVVGGGRGRRVKGRRLRWGGLMERWWGV